MPMLRILSRALDVVVLPAVLLSLWLAFLYAPPEATMHDVYRIFYFHVPATASAGLGIGIVFVCSVLYLRTRQQHGHAVGAAGVGRLLDPRRYSPDDHGRRLPDLRGVSDGARRRGRRGAARPPLRRDRRLRRCRRADRLLLH